VNTYVTEVVSQSGFHEVTRRGIQRLAWRLQNLVDDRRHPLAGAFVAGSTAVALTLKDEAGFQ
jgi:hypothetical protein